MVAWSGNRRDLAKMTGAATIAGAFCTIPGIDRALAQDASHAEVEQVIRDGNATPATIAVLDGVPRVGLSRDELETLATHPDVAKVSLRDLPHVIARRGHGATTVASTMRLAALAGIPVFVTGGLGGVHRGATTTMQRKVPALPL